MQKSDKETCNKVLHEMKKIPKKVKDQLKPLVQKILAKCSDVKVLTKKVEWDEMKEILELLEAVQNIEKNYKPPLSNRKDHWERFYEWCSENGAEFASIKVEEITEGDFGVKARKDIKESEPFLTIPRKIMMSEISAKTSKLGPLISKDPILQNMPNVQITMHLLAELLDPKSFWSPYISILPASYSTILYFTIEDIKELQKSPTIDEVLKILRCVIRQYCYFFQLFEHDSSAKSLNIGPYFTFELYRWAVSSIMTRQNVLPSSDGETHVTSLVPLFDMCNHCNGKLSTDFNLESDSLISYSFRAFSEGEEIYMCYGPRPNAEFLVHNGFVYPENENDAVEIKLGISKNDPLYALKCDLCSKLEISVNGPFYLCKDELVGSELLMFLEINVMKSDELERILNNKEQKQNTELLLQESPDLKKRAFSFLRDRVNLLLKSYGSTLEEDEDLLKQSASASKVYLSVLKLRMCEKKIFADTYEYCLQKIT